MAVFFRYAKFLKAYSTSMHMRTALQLLNQVLNGFSSYIDILCFCIRDTQLKKNLKP